MEKEDRRIMILGNIASALIKAMSMFSHDLYEMNIGSNQVYSEESYANIIEEYGVHSNAIISMLQD